MGQMPIRKEMKARYPRDWKLRSRFIRFYRPRNRCEWCGAANYQLHPVTGRKVMLTVAHLFDHRPEAASLLNLAALCQRLPQPPRRQEPVVGSLGAVWIAKGRPSVAAAAAYVSPKASFSKERY